MKAVIKKFLSDNEELVIRCTILNDSEAFDVLNEKFHNYLFKIYLLSYINKSIVYTSLDLKKKINSVRYNEQAILNVINYGYTEEKINLIPSKPIDFIQEIIERDTTTDFREIFSDSKILFIVNNLTDRQKEILYLKFVLCLPEDTIATQLHISKQSVNKTKNTALGKVRRALSG